MKEDIGMYLTCDSNSSSGLEPFEDLNSHAETERKQNSNPLSPKPKKPKMPRKHKSQRKGDGKETDIVPNLVKKLIHFIKKHKKEFLIQFTLKPTRWTLKAELILICLKYRFVDLLDRNLFIAEVKKNLDKMITFRIKKIGENDRV